MESKVVEKLLERYYEGNTSEGEEHKLRAYFEGEDVPNHLKPVQLQFKYFQNASLEKLEDHSFEKKVIDKIRAQSSHERKFNLLGLNFSKLSIAASLLLLLGYFFLAQPDFFKREDSITKSTVNDPEQAYLETQKALLLISQKLNKGNRELKKIEDLNKLKF
ncbi:hypothetical protein [Xanthovirga aplysinae]|uniref:hypothetical protein n=1 Tax=Xanthovirga aplysinae TaxID=2529853 RepID=UPI0012BD6393|nr:hypothetical protein [Xanthovirga aplysinae]MTI32703.1 hypothetical protein [Xanthovirga aplysinae]